MNADARRRVTAHTALEQVRDLTGGGMYIAAEFAGAETALAFSFDATVRGDTTVTAGLPLSPVQLVGQERRLLGSYLGGHVPKLDIPEYIGLYQAG